MSILNLCLAPICIVSISTPPCSTTSVGISLPTLCSQVTLGGGLPSARHENAAVSSCRTVRFSGPDVILGATVEEKQHVC